MSPSVSRVQQQAAGMALACKRGQIAVGDLKGAALEMYKSMTVKQLVEFASTARQSLPRRKR